MASRACARPPGRKSPRPSGGPSDAIERGERILLIDDPVATGGTAEAAATLIAKMGGEVVECRVVIDLPDVGGRKRPEKLGLAVHALCEFEGD
jgi:adenine phosphoribosyltransferase